MHCIKNDIKNCMYKNLKTKMLKQMFPSLLINKGFIYYVEVKYYLHRVEQYNNIIQKLFLNIYF